MKTADEYINNTMFQKKIQGQKGEILCIGPEVLSKAEPTLKCGRCQVLSAGQDMDFQGPQRD